MKPVEKLITEHKLQDTVWGNRLIQAEVEGVQDNVIRAAGDWVTCACGVQDPRIPRDTFDNAPTDTILSSLGKLFYRQVQQRDAYSAAMTLIKIEKRAAQVLRAALSPWERLRASVRRAFKLLRQ